MILRSQSAFAVAVLCFLLPQVAAAADIKNHTQWKDTQGNLIDCHEGGILRIGSTFYWYGRSYKGNVDGIYGAGGAQFRCGLVCYSSTDLANWTNRGTILAYPASGFLTGGTWHRPRVLYNEQTRKYVLWFFMFPNGKPSFFTMVVATADSPTGPFTVLTGPEFHVSGDLALYQASDGKGYLAWEEGRKLRVSQLTGDFLNLAGPVTTALQEGGDHEGTSIALYKGKYIVAGSGVAGLNPTDTSYAVSDSILGPYTYKGLMSEQNTWKSQISAFFYLAESNRLIAMCEQWLTGPNGERVPAEQSCQLWLPVTFDPATGVARMEHVNQWDPWAAEPGTAPPGEGGSPPPGSGQKGWWKLDEAAGSTAFDTSGNDNDGAISGASWAQGKAGGALRFNGLDGRVIVPDSPSLQVSGAVTLSAWVFLMGYPTGANDTVIGKGGSYSMAWNGAGHFLSYLNGLGSPVRDSGSVIGLSVWTHLALTFDGSTRRFYLDGRLLHEAAESGAFSSGSGELRIGDWAGGGETVNALVDEVRLYQGALSSDEILALAEPGAGGNSPPPMVGGTGSAGTASAGGSGHSSSPCGLGVAGAEESMPLLIIGAAALLLGSVRRR